MHQPLTEWLKVHKICPPQLPRDTEAVALERGCFLEGNQDRFARSFVVIPASTAVCIFRAIDKLLGTGEADIDEGGFSCTWARSRKVGSKPCLLARAAGSDLFYLSHDQQRNQGNSICGQVNKALNFRRNYAVFTLKQLRPLFAGELCPIGEKESQNPTVCSGWRVVIESAE